MRIKVNKNNGKYIEFGFERNALKTLGRLYVIIERITLELPYLANCQHVQGVITPTEINMLLTFATALLIVDRVIFCSYLQRLSLLGLSAKYLDTLKYIF